MMKFLNTGEGCPSQENPWIEGMCQRFNDGSVPLKIRKLELMEEVGLPVPDTTVFAIGDTAGIVAHIEERSRDDELPVIIRLACIPDKFSMPALYINNEDDLVNLNEELDQLLSAGTIRKVIVQQAVSKKDAKDRIVGRLLFPGKNTIEEEVLELYKGSRSTSVFDHLNNDDPNYQRFVKIYGKFMKPETMIQNNQGLIGYEIKDVYSKLSEFKDKIGLIREVTTHDDHEQAQSPVCIEFSYLNSKMLFTDID